MNNISGEFEIFFQPERLILEDNEDYYIHQNQSLESEANFCKSQYVHHIFCIATFFGLNCELRIAGDGIN